MDMVKIIINLTNFYIFCPKNKNKYIFIFYFPTPLSIFDFFLF